MIKGSIQQEGKTIVHDVHQQQSTCVYIQMLTNLKGVINDNAIIIAQDFNTLLSIMNRISTQKIKKETIYLNNTIDQMNLRDHRTFHPTAEGYTFFSNAHRTNSRADHIMSQNKYKKIAVISSLFSGHNE